MPWGRRALPPHENYVNRSLSCGNPIKQHEMLWSPFQPPERLLRSLHSYTGLHFNQLPSICPHGLQPIAPPSDLVRRIPLYYVPHTCRQPIRTGQLAVSSLLYYPYRTIWFRGPILSHPHEPLNTPRSDAEPVWKSTYPYPASYCLKLSTVFTRLLNVSVLA